MNFKVTVSEIFREFHSEGVLVECSGPEAITFQRLTAVEDCGPGDLVFMDKKDYLETIRSRRPSVVVTTAALAKELTASDQMAILTAPQVGLAHALIKQKYGARSYAMSGWHGVHPSAVVHESANIGAHTVIEPNVVIAAKAHIGENCRIMAGAIIENGAVIGDNTIIHPKAVIGYECRIGASCDIGPGTVIGSEGFGFAQDAKRKSHAIPQTGIVVIEDRVRLGANNCIDRAAYKETRIGAGTKTDNLCHVAHNVTIGQDCLLTAMLVVAGSTKIGDRVITSGQTGILDHLSIASDTVFLHRAGVTKDIEKPGAYAGLPLQPLGDYMKNMAVARGLVELRQRISDLEKKIASDVEPTAPTVR